MQIYHDFDVSQILWYKIGGKAKYVLNCSNQADITTAIEFIKKKQIKKVFVCGLGSNLIFSDNYFDGVIIRITPSKKISQAIYITQQGFVKSFSGQLLDDIIQFGFANNLIGLEWAGGLPGTVGAAVRGNVGAFGGEVKDVIESAEVLDCFHSSIVQEFTNAQLQFVYRGSLVKTNRNLIIVSAVFHLQSATDNAVAKARMVYEQNKQYRRYHHPLEYPNCGSVFKNLRDPDQIGKALSIYPDLREQVATQWHGKLAVAPLIQRLGFKGYQIGDAQVSNKHALFIVNLGHAKAKDVLQIIHKIQEKFQEKFGFSLETEVEIIS